MKKFNAVLVSTLILCICCSGSRNVKKKDPLGRITSSLSYRGASVDYSEEFEYYGNSHNPRRIIYRKKTSRGLEPFREEVYTFKPDGLSKILFYVYVNNKKKHTGEILFYYNGKKIQRKEYYALPVSGKQIALFGLDQYTYKDGVRTERRIIEYEYMPALGKSMQIGQYVVFYRKGCVSYMKLWIMDKKSKKIIEQMEKDTQFVDMKIRNIEKFYLNRTKGEQFIR